MDKHDAPAPKVSVVIPTRNRSDLLMRAVAGALRQTFSDLEVIVVIDGPDPATTQTLERVNDERLRTICLTENVGGSEARNVGARAGRGEWIALLDDDDEWFPEKIEKQLAAVRSGAAKHFVVACQFFERAENSERMLPARLPAPGEHFSDYMFSRRGWSSAEGFLQTSTWLISRQLLLDVPFTPGLERCQDLDWLLHATVLTETKVIVVPEPLAIFHHDERGERVSRTPDWKFLYAWASTNRRYFTARAFAFFIATFCAPSAAKQSAPFGTFLVLLWRCVATRAATPKCLLLFFICWLMPESRRRTLRSKLRTAVVPPAKVCLPGGLP